MPCSPRDLFALAKRLHEGDDCEAAGRCVVSRAYYAALHQVEATFEKRAAEFRIDGESSHREIISRASIYGKSTNPGRGHASAIAKEMTRLRRARNQADYSIGEEFFPKEASEILFRVDRVIALCDQITDMRSGAQA